MQKETEVFPGDYDALMESLMLQMKITDPKKVIGRIISGEWIVSPTVSRWREQHNLIRFFVESYGRTGPQWINELRDLPDFVKDMLNSPEFKPTNGFLTEIGILRGPLYNGFSVKKMFTKNRRHMIRPNAEIACLIAEMFTADEIFHGMMLHDINIMHKPIKYQDGSCIFNVDDSGLLGAVCIDSDDIPHPNSGFAFAYC